MTEQIVIEHIEPAEQEFVVERDPFLVRKEKAQAAMKSMQVDDVMWVANPNPLFRFVPNRIGHVLTPEEAAELTAKRAQATKRFTSRPQIRNGVSGTIYKRTK